MSTIKTALKSYSLKEISQWQKEISVKVSKILLPSLQRGFVWKPNQIEALWDSIFRGFPIGAILMSIDKDDNHNLLDGQQRCTTIALGHFSPFEENTGQFLSLKTYKPSIWLDLKPSKTANGLKFNFRCLTQSHPWGYQLIKPNSTLSMSDRKNALSYFNTEQSVERYTDLLSKDINPWDAYFPIPLSFIINSEKDNFIEFKNEILLKSKELKIETKYSLEMPVDYTKVDDHSWELIFKGFENYNSLQIPEIVIDSLVLKEEVGSLNNDAEDPTLFVRLNSAGTRISGEELNYSIYKAYFPDVKELVENIGASYINPSKVIALFSRLAACKQTDYKQYQNDFPINTFRKKISEVDFKANIQEIIVNHTSDKINEPSSNLINQSISIIENGENDLPKILIKQIITSNIDLFFVLLVYINKVEFKNLTDIKKREIASCYLYILWFNRDNKKVGAQLFAVLFNENENYSWTVAVNKLISSNIIIPLVEPNVLLENLKVITIKHKIHHNSIDKIKDENLFNNEIRKALNYDANNNLALENFRQLINQIFGNKSMLLLAQKEYIKDKFKDFNQFENIDDTNRPWDWDHIYPNSWVYRNEGISKMVKDWVNCIGNFRALSYDDNRSENNHVSPKDRFTEGVVRTASYINESDLKYWNEIDNTFSRIKKGDSVKEDIFLNAVICRLINIYDNYCKLYPLNLDK